jgi:osmotically-inducible protein OsmY
MKLRRASIGVLVAFAVTLALAGGAASREVSDAEITEAVEMEIWGDHAVEANNIDVETREGVVTLTGTVGNILAKERAEAIASAIVGVRAIINRIDVKPVERTDSKLEKAVENALLRDPATDSYEVNPVVDNGVVTLTGNVDSWQEKQLCESVVKGVKGVRDVRDNLNVRYVAHRPDSEIKSEIEARLANDVMVDDYLIRVDVKNERVTLTGAAGSLFEKNRAFSDAWVADVKGVDDSGLTVRWWARDEMRRKSNYVARSDDEIKQAVIDALQYDPRIFSFNPDVNVDHGTVTLRGVVGNLKAKNAAGQDARDVIGVWRVKDYLKVRPDVVPADSVLESRVRSALLEDPYVSRFDIDVHVYEGGVYLRGNVNTSFEAQQAAWVAETVKGVLYVVNSLNYDYKWVWKPDWVIREDVKEELQWSPFVEEQNVDVRVVDGVVYLTGTVDTWGERQAAENDAYKGGAKDVRNQLVVNYEFYGPHYRPATLFPRTR